MKNKKHVVIFSHGFGTKKDDCGFFLGEHGIANALNNIGIETILFDYNSFDSSNNIMTITPLSIQVKILKEVILNTQKKYPNAIIDIIGHSQGALVPLMLLPKNIRKTILLAPSLDANSKKIIDYFQKRPKTKIDFKEISYIERKDGTLSVVPSQYWVDRNNIEPVSSCNEFSKITEMFIIIGNQDTTFGDLGANDLSKNIKVINLDGNHNFHNENRENLINRVKEIICS